ncbi:response regulator receiver domain-containing protein [Dongia mobilis]|uniref:Response regulator receiver domain-containing protein n=1 Tax=Dongia mobilis TaxID=578943 RepID=A0A4V3DF67_9PROT|nr:response regulator [Dongia mobilis]TDQ83430.1 response regulator receiver domain-containing protein [Dongia mobilis]
MTTSPDRTQQAMDTPAQWMVLCLSALSHGDDPLFAEESAEECSAANQRPWNILLVDDDEEVHHAMDLALGNAVIHGRALRIEHCHSASAAHEMLAAESPRVDLVLLDVVMETEDAGLGLLDEIRTQPATRDLPVLLHTGQPGRAPESAVRRRYDISGYLTKSNVTRPILVTALESALLGRKLP